MRICILTIAAYPHGIGGIQSHTSDLARGLVRAGHQVEVLAARHPDGLVEEESDGVRWHFVDAPGHHMDRDWRHRSHGAFVRLQARRPFDVVHGQGSSALELLRRDVHREVAVVTLFHGNFLGLARAAARRARSARAPRPLLREGHRLLSLSRDHFPHGNWYRFRACEAIVPARQQVIDTRRSHLLDPARLHVVPNGIDDRVFRPADRAALRDRLGLPDGPLFACVGRLNSEKGYHHAIRALAALNGGAPEARLVIVGDGEERTRLEALASELRVGHRVLFAGAQPKELVAAHLAAADAFLFPTEREEAAPLVLPQAMACSLPVVASRIGGITEVVDRPGENGLLVAPGDLGALVEAMRLLASDDDLRRRLGNAARDRVLAEYTLERMTERTVAVYELARDRLAASSARR
jgi:glycosyltransferase involved in cell wall biosynthesis